MTRVETPWTVDRWLPQVEMLRGVAAMAVVVHHIYEQIYGVNGGWPIGTMLGAWGLTLFFVISGFCIHLPQARRFAAGDGVAPAWGGFYWQRFRRIVPAYWAALLASAIAGHYFQTNLIGSPTIHSTVSHALFVHQFTGDTRLINGVFWTIGVEMHFYLLYPVYFHLRKRVGPAAATLIALMIGVAYYTAATLLTEPGSDFRWEMQVVFPALWWQWCLGAWLAEAYLARTTPRIFLRIIRFPGATLFWAITSICLIYVKWRFFHLVDHGVELIRFRVSGWMLPVFCAFLLASATTTANRLPDILGRALHAAGLRSYSLYLIHPVAIALALPIVDSTSIPFQCIAMFAASLLLAWTLFATVERFSLRPKNQSPGVSPTARAAA